MTSMSPVRPTLLNSCAFATSAAEARFRIDAAPQPDRQTRVVALDPGASAVVRPLIGLPWRSSKFLTYAPNRMLPAPTNAATLTNTVDGSDVPLTQALNDADFVLMVATANDGAPAASAIGLECVRRGIMTAAVVLGEWHAVDDAVNALRPHARVLLVSRDHGDVAELMSVVAS
jgi:hypothetical protein